MSRALRIAQRPRPAGGACGEATCSLTTSCRMRSFLGICACYQPRHVGRRLTTARHATPTAGPERRLQWWLISWCAHRAYFKFARLHDLVHLTPALVVHATACDVSFCPPPHLTLFIQPCAACLVSSLPCSLCPPRHPLCLTDPVMCQIHFVLPPTHVTVCIVAWYW